MNVDRCEKHAYMWVGNEGRCGHQFTPPGTRGILTCNRLLNDQRHILPACEHCGGSGVLNAHTIEVRALSDPEPVEWTVEATWCHACENGKLWEGLL